MKKIPALMLPVACAAVAGCTSTPAPKAPVIADGETEAAPNQKAARENLLDFAGQRVGPHVEILRLAAEKEVADAASDEVGLEAGV